MGYQDIGFDENLQRVDPATSVQSGGNELDPLQTDTYLQEMSGDKIQGGIISSPDGRLRIDLNTGTLYINNGVQDLIALGVQADGSIGFLLKDNDGNILMNVTGNENYIQSALQTMKLDFVKEQLTVRDAQQILRVLVGKDEDGF